MSSDAGRVGILRLQQKALNADVPALYVRLVDAATPSACSLFRRAVSETSALQGWVMVEGSHEGQGRETWTAATGTEHQQGRSRLGSGSSG